MANKYLTSLKIFFWGVIFLTIISVPTILYLNSKSLIPQILFSNNPEIFSNGLSLIFGVIGFIIASIIFLMEFIASRYHSEELDDFPIFKKYFITTLAMFFIFIIFDLLSLYRGLIYPYTLISLLFSISVILLIITTILFVLFNLQVSNIIGMLSDNITNFIKKKRQFKTLPFVGEVSYSDEFISLLNRKINVLIKNSLNAIKKDQDIIFREAIKGIENASLEYLKNSKHLSSVEDKFLSELNDQFNFIVNEALNSTNQKILEDLARTIGLISRYIIENRKGLGDINNFSLNWIATLKDIFIKSYTKDRTVVCYVCLEEINKTVLLTLDKGYYQSYNTYRMFLDEISISLSKTNSYWSASLLQRALSMYQQQFLKFIDLGKEGVFFNDFFIEQYFREISNLVNNAKSDYKTFMNKTIMFASLYGLDSFAQKIAKTNLSHLRDGKIKRGIFRYLDNFIKFNKIIAQTNASENDNNFYDVFSETLFLLSKYVDIEEGDKIKLIAELSDILLTDIERKSNAIIEGEKHNVIDIRGTIIDYFALLIYLNSDKPELLKRIFSRFLEIYITIKKKDKKEFVSGRLYRELKLYSCWINEFDNLKEVNKEIIKILKKDFYEPKTEGRAMPPLFAQFGYPSGFIGDGAWYLHPSYMWGNRFQDEISNKFNKQDGKNYIEFHKKLKKSKS